MLAVAYKNVHYALYMGSRPQTLYGIADSPVGLAAWMIDFPCSLNMIARSIDGLPESLTRDDVLDNCRGAGRRRRIPSSFTSTESPRAVILPLGNSRRSSRVNCAPASEHCADSGADGLRAEDGAAILDAAITAIGNHAYAGVRTCFDQAEFERSVPADGAQRYRSIYSLVCQLNRG